MAVTPKSGTPKGGTRAAKPKSQPGMLSASEALKAAEAAIEPARAPARKPVAAPVAAKVKAPVAKAAPVKKVAPQKPLAPVTDPIAVTAASTVVDAAPEPASVKPVTPLTSAAAKAEPVVPEVKSTPARPTPAKSAPSAPVAPTSAEGTQIMNDVIETSKKYAEDAKAKLETAYAQLNEKAKVGVEKSTKALEEISDIAKGNVEAFVESGKIAAKAVETLGQDAVDYSKKSFEKAQASFKSFSGVKTPTEFFQLQSQLFSSAFDDFTKEAAKSNEAFLKLAGEVAQPLTARVTVVTDKIKSLAA